VLSHSKQQSRRPCGTNGFAFVPYVPCSRTASSVVETGSEAVRLSSPSSQRGEPFPRVQRDVPAPTKEESAKNLGQLFDHRAFVSGRPTLYPRYNSSMPGPPLPAPVVCRSNAELLHRARRRRSGFELHLFTGITEPARNPMTLTMLGSWV